MAEGELKEGDYETDVSDEEDEDERAEDDNKVDDDDTRNDSLSLSLCFPRSPLGEGW